MEFVRGCGVSRRVCVAPLSRYPRSKDRFSSSIFYMAILFILAVARSADGSLLGATDGIQTDRIQFSHPRSCGPCWLTSSNDEREDLGRLIKGSRGSSFEFYVHQ